MKAPFARSTVELPITGRGAGGHVGGLSATGGVAVAFALPALILGFGLRLVPVLTAAFPLNDGGMFYTMIEDVKISQFALPDFTSYNLGNVPFAYPPLGFYAAAAVSSLFHVDTLTVLRVLPAVVSCLTLLAFYRLARAVLPSIGAVAALFAFALLPRSFEWEIMGGGLTRSFAFLFAILALTDLTYLLRDGNARRVVFASVLCGLTVLSHLEFAWFLAFSAALLMAIWVRRRAGVVHAVLVACGTLVVSSPWWLTLLLRHGLGPLVAAGQTGGTFSIGLVLSGLAQLDLTEETLFSPALILGVVGLLLCLRDRRYLLPAWVAVCLILDPRKYLTDVTVPLALLVGVALEEVVLPFLTQTRARFHRADPASAPPASKLEPATAPRGLAPVVLGAALMYALFSAIGSPAVAGSLTTLPHSERAAMAWVSANTPAGARFLVISGEAWGLDRSAEWFPTLADRVSVATVQGSEWLPHGGFAAQLNRDEAVQECAAAGADCLTDWRRSTGVTFDYVYVNKRSPVRVHILAPGSPYHWALEYALRADPGYRVVYDDSGAVVFAVVHHPSAALSPHQQPVAAASRAS